MELRKVTVKEPIAPKADKTIAIKVFFSTRDGEYGVCFFFLPRLLHSELHDGSATTLHITFRARSGPVKFRIPLTPKIARSPERGSKYTTSAIVVSPCRQQQ
jgi:hypothetical protein